VAVYISEAHASDEWPVGPTISSCRQPQSVEERCKLAQQFVNTRLYRVPMLVDTIENDFQTAFAAWPFRYFIMKENRIAYKAEPSVMDLCYDAQDLSTLIPTLI